MGWFISIKNSN